MIKKIFKRLYYRLHSNYTTEQLIEMGLQVGNNFQRMQEVILDPSHCWHIKIGNNVTIAPRVHILAHDASLIKHLGYARIGNVIIEDNVFIGADSVILPNVTIGKNSIIGANSVISRDVPPNVVVAGNPAKIITSLDNFIDKNKEMMKNRPVFGEEFTMRKGISKSMKKKMFKDLINGFGFVR